MISMVGRTTMEGESSSMRSTRTKRTKWLKMLLYSVGCGALLLAGKTPAAAVTEAVYEYNVKPGEEKVCRGVVNTDELNVRTAAGKKNPVVQVNGKGVKLNKKDEVAILDKTSSSGETWYKVSFRMGETLVVGYVHGSYVELTKDVITPLPTVSPEPTTDTQGGKSGWSTFSRIVSIILRIIGIGILIAVTIAIFLKSGAEGSVLIWGVSWGISIIGYIFLGWLLPFEELRWSWSGLVFLVRVISLLVFIIIGRKDAPDDEIATPFFVIAGISFFGILIAGGIALGGSRAAGNVCLSFLVITVTSFIIGIIFSDFDSSGPSSIDLGCPGGGCL